MKHIVSFSGGKDSTAMLLLMIEKGWQIDDIVFMDTGMEFDELYDSIEKVRAMIPYPITTIRSEHTYEYWMFDHVKTKGKNQGSKGYSWADFRNRWCTATMKRDVMARYLKTKYAKEETVEYIGIAIDEPKRLVKNAQKNIRFPLAEWNLTEAECLQYCYSKGLDWGGVYDKIGRVSCWCCPLKNLSELRVIYRDYPHYWAKLKDFDSRTYRKFRADYSIDELEVKFNKENQLYLY